MTQIPKIQTPATTAIKMFRCFFSIFHQPFKIISRRYFYALRKQRHGQHYLPPLYHVRELIQHILPYFAVIGHILGGRRIKAGGKNRKASQTNLFGWRGLTYFTDNHMEKDSKNKRAGYSSTGGMSSAKVTLTLHQ